MKKLLPIILLLLSACTTAIAGPYINAAPQVLNSFHYTTGSAGPSASQTVVLQSAIMATSSGTVTVSGTSDYEVSLNNSSFSSSVSIPYSDDTLGATNVYIRLKSGLGAGAYMGKTISITATGISAAVTANGFVTNPCVITTGAITGSSASFTWTATGAASYECIINQSAAAPTIAGTPAMTASYSQGSLSPGTAYYFHVRGVGASDNYTAWTTKAFSTATTDITRTAGSSHSISLTPNPSRGRFIVSGTAGSNPVPISVVNAAGQLVYSTTATPERGAFSKAIGLDVPAGVYTILVGTDRVVSRLVMTP